MGFSIISGINLTGKIIGRNRDPETLRDTARAGRLSLLTAVGAPAVEAAKGHARRGLSRAAGKSRIG